MSPLATREPASGSTSSDGIGGKRFSRNTIAARIT